MNKGMKKPHGSFWGYGISVGVEGLQSQDKAKLRPDFFCFLLANVCNLEAQVSGCSPMAAEAKSTVTGNITGRESQVL